MSQRRNERFLRLYEAVEAERQEEERYFSALQAQKTILEKIELGIVWYPVQLQKRRYGLGDYIELSFERTKYQDKSHRLKTGSGVLLYRQGLQETISYKAVISFIRKDQIKLYVGDESSIRDTALDHGLWAIELVYDERPYTIMKATLQALIDNNTPAFLNIKDAFLNLSFSVSRLPGIPKEHLIENLNDSQKEAIHNVSKTEDFAIIHGPPGTGKTTTIVQLVRKLVKEEKRILVCAPSNNAVDLLAYLLHDVGLNVLRIGNVSKIDNDTVHLTLAEKSRSHPDWKQIKKIKIEAEEALYQAKQYKRSFGEKERNDRKTMYREAKELKAWARDLEDRLMENLVDEAQVVCTTLIGAAHKSIGHLKFKTVVIDEASQALEPECWHVILKAERCVLVGDHKQLAPVVKSPKAIDKGLDKTLLETLKGNIPYDALLNTQYRMHPEILAFSNKRFYAEQLQSASVVSNRTLPNDTEPFVFIDTSGCGFDEQFTEKARSYSNPEEFYILREYILLQKEKQMGHSIGIISPYSGQVKWMKDYVAQDEELKALEMDIGTIDGFQGQERDIIYISLVRSNIQGNIGFLSDERRLNVAMTRAKKKLVIIGDSATLSSHVLFRDLLKHVEENATYKSAWEFMMM